MTDQMTWDGSWRGPMQQTGLRDEAYRIVAWINSLGGEARYDLEGVFEGITGGRYGPAIVIRTATGWDLFVKPGDTVIDTGEWIHPSDGTLCASKDECMVEHTVRLFRVAAAGAGTRRRCTEGACDRFAGHPGDHLERCAATAGCTERAGHRRRCTTGSWGPLAQGWFAAGAGSET